MRAAAEHRSRPRPRPAAALTAIPDDNLVLVLAQNTVVSPPARVLALVSSSRGKLSLC